MKRTLFHSIIRIKNGMAIIEHDGFEFELNGRKFNAYRAEYGAVCIIDPETGRSLFDYEADDKLDVEAVRTTIDVLKRKDNLLDSFEKTTNTERYKTYKEMFKAFETGWALEEKLRLGGNI